MMGIFSFISFILIGVVLGKREKDRVTQLPEVDPSLMQSSWFSGYFEVSSTRHMHYIFVESLGNVSSDPIIVFFNGGPGGPSTFLAF
jgi:carboxypeptidase C (cathepsin A)